eukprot:g1632.t1
MVAKQKHELALKLHNAGKDADLKRTLIEYNAIGVETSLNNNSINGNTKLTKEIGSKYINKLLSTAKNREARNNIAKERLIQRRQDEEAEIYGETEVFVTAAYKKKLDDDKKQEEILHDIGYLDRSKSTSIPTNDGSSKVIYINNIGDACEKNIPLTGPKPLNIDNKANKPVMNNKCVVADMQPIKRQEVKKAPLTVEEKLMAARERYEQRKSQRNRSNIIF